MCFCQKLTPNTLNQVLLQAKWPVKNRDGYTLWRLLRNTFLATTAFMEPIKAYRQFKAPPLQATWNLQMGLKAENRDGKSCSRSMEGDFQISAKTSPTPPEEEFGALTLSKPEPRPEPEPEPELVPDTEDVFEPRSEIPEVERKTSIIKNGPTSESDGENAEDSENELIAEKPVPNFSDSPPPPVPPTRSHGLPAPPKSRSELNLDEIAGFVGNEQQNAPFSNPATPTATPPLIPAQSCKMAYPGYDTKI